MAVVLVQGCVCVTVVRAGREESQHDRVDLGGATAVCGVSVRGGATAVCGVCGRGGATAVCGVSVRGALWGCVWGVCERSSRGQVQRLQRQLAEYEKSGQGSGVESGQGSGVEGQGGGVEVQGSSGVKELQLALTSAQQWNRPVQTVLRQLE